jgi:hypothetical protein
MLNPGRPPLDCEPRGAIAQLGERLDRTQEVAGSSPASSMKKKALHEGLFRSASSVENPNEERVAVGALGMTLVEGTEGR